MPGPPTAVPTALHLALLRPAAAEVEAAFAREDAAAHEAWTSGLLTAGVAGFWNTKETTDMITTRAAVLNAINEPSS